MSEFSKSELIEILETREEKIFSRIEAILASTVEKNFLKFETSLLKHDSEITAKITNNEKEIESMKHDTAQLMARSERVFSLIDSQREYIERINRKIILTQGGGIAIVFILGILIKIFL